MNLFVASLPFSVGDEELKEFFETVGPVKSSKVILDRDTGRSRGFGFVEFESPEDGNRAIQELNGREMDGRPITVKVAEKRERSPR